MLKTDAGIDRDAILTKLIHDFRISSHGQQVMAESVKRFLSAPLNRV
ncbi:MAG: hypothetical protein FWH56_04535 [Betaproteobacteria bacterium]|nr:hypothetical protein [Betaproteobacteria bacterium]